MFTIDWNSVSNKHKSGIKFKEGGSNVYGGQIYYDGEADKLILSTHENDSEKYGISLIRESGNVGIGTTTQGSKLQVGNSGDGTSAVTNVWTTFSDIRLKENIQEITPKEALQDVLNLRGVRFNWKNDSTKKVNIGLIAQEVEKIIPEVVNTGRDGY